MCHRSASESKKSDSVSSFPEAAVAVERTAVLEEEGNREAAEGPPLAWNPVRRNVNRDAEVVRCCAIHTPPPRHNKENALWRGGGHGN